ncbi:hypothetical protein [Kitasatospora sp. MBT63]|uniref:hypothetical protein n=1 Tax=Kitasatospora sp. MBT63 TaxID=1444768 RepID=UPI000AA37D0D|nr:hypothetical protein [Kitasatospora sp. MBT63]
MLALGGVGDSRDQHGRSQNRGDLLLASVPRSADPSAAAVSLGLLATFLLGAHLGGPGLGLTDLLKGLGGEGVGLRPDPLGLAVGGLDGALGVRLGPAPSRPGEPGLLGNGCLGLLPEPLGGLLAALAGGGGLAGALLQDG